MCGGGGCVQTSDTPSVVLAPQPTTIVKDWSHSTAAVLSALAQWQCPHLHQLLPHYARHLRKHSCATQLTHGDGAGVSVVHAGLVGRGVRAACALRVHLAGGQTRARGGRRSTRPVKPRQRASTPAIKRTLWKLIDTKAAPTVEQQP